MPVPDVKHDGLIVLFSIGVILLVIIVAVLMFRRRKGNHSILYLFVALKLVNFKICTVADRNHSKIEAKYLSQRTPTQSASNGINYV